MIHFNCPTFSGNPNMRPLVFDWDEDAGEVYGPDADYVRDVREPGALRFTRYRAITRSAKSR